MVDSPSVPEAADAISPARRRFDRWLYVSYFRGAGVRHWFFRRLRPAALGLGVVTIVAASLGIGHQRTPIYQLFSLGVAMGSIGLPWVALRRARLSGRRQVPAYATVGVPLRYGVRVRNLGRRTLRRAWLTESPPDPRPSADEFILLREPGEEERNRFDRTFAYFRWQWLLLRNRLFTESQSHQELRIKPGQDVRATIELTPLRRGVIRMNDLRVLLPDAFGLFQRCVKVAAPPATLIVLPRRYPLPTVRLPVGADFNISGDTNTNAIGNSGEFVGLRDYRPGDPLRQIHWKSWARTGTPIVKELEDTFYPRYGLVLDTLSTARSDVAFEEAVSVAASFAASLDSNESLLDLMFIKNEAHKVTAGRGLERAEKLLEVLAGVTPERRDNFKVLGELVLRHRDDLSACLVILNGWDEPRQQLLQTLRKGGVICVPIIVGTGSRHTGAPGYWLDAMNIARDLKRLPEQLVPLAC